MLHLFRWILTISSDELRHQSWFNTLLLGLTIILLASLLYLGSAQRGTDQNMLLMACASVISYTAMRGVHMQFLLWIWFSLPYVLIRGARVHPVIAMILMWSMDWCHSWVSNVIQPLLLLDAGRHVIHGNWTEVQLSLSRVFSQLKSAPRDTNKPLVQMLGAYYETGFNVTVIPASFVLCMTTCYITWRILSSFGAKNTEHEHVD